MNSHQSIARALLGAFALGTGAASGVRGTPGRPVIRLFGDAEVHAKGPVLAFAETDDGTLVVGSNHLVKFDGHQWQSIEVAGGYAFRALAAEHARQRVWVGGVGAIGYLEPDLRGVWTFVSLAPALRASGDRPPAEIRYVAATAAGALFVSGREALRWDGVHFSVWPLPSPTALKTAADGTSVLILQPGVGLWRLGAEGGPVKVMDIGRCPSADADWIVVPAALGASDSSELAGLLWGSAGGAFRLRPDGWVRLPALSDTLAGAGASEAIPLPGDAVAFATARLGTVLASQGGAVQATIDQTAGLASNVVHGLWSDRRGALWMGLDEGCARLDRLGVASTFDVREGLTEGLPRRVTKAAGALFIMTDRALYRLDASPGSGRLVPLFSDHPGLNDAIGTKGALLFGGVDGLWRFQAPAGPVDQPANFNAKVLARCGWLASGILAASPGHLYTLASDRPPWRVLDLGAAIDDDPISLSVGADNDAWVGYGSGAIDRFALMAPPLAEPRLRRTQRWEPGAGLPAGISHSVMVHSGARIFALTDGPILEWTADTGWARVPELAQWVGFATAGGRGPAPVSYWLVHETGLPDSPPFDILRVSADAAPRGRIAYQPLRAAGMDFPGEVTSFDVEDAQGQPVGYIGGKGGLLRLELHSVLPVPVIRALEMREARIDGDRLLALHPKTPVQLPHGLRRISFGYSAAQPMEPDPLVYYETRLAGVDPDWSAPERKTSSEFTGLAAGSYTFMVRRLDRHGRIGAAVTYPFVILPPWYASWPAVTVELALVVAGAWLIYRRRVRALHLQTERLDRLVAQRTRELELSNTAKSEFLENISHEIRNPLQGIVGLARMLEPSRLPPEERAVAESLRTTAEHLRRVSEDVLELSRSEFGAASVAAQPFALGSVLRELAGAEAEGFRRAGSTVRVALSHPATDRFLGDETKIRTIIRNFLTNALKYAPGAAVEVRADWTDEGDGAQVFIAVTDNGPGIPADEQELIFQKFVRGQAAKGGAAPGTGIGLATCRTLARQMGGSVGVESPPGTPLPEPGGVGSSFHLWLPLRHAAGEITVSAAAAERTKPAMPQAGAVGRALVIDDEPYNRLVLAGLCRELGYDAVAVDTPEAADAAMRSAPADVILADFEVAGHKGDAIARHLRELPFGKLAVILAVSGSDSEETRSRCHAAGMDGFLLKPFSAAEARAAIAAVRSRALEDYARGAQVDPAQAIADLDAAIAAELKAIAGAAMPLKRTILHDSAHRLRTLAALGRLPSLNALAAKLETEALSASDANLADLIARFNAPA